MKKELRQTVLNQMKKLAGKEKEQADSWLTQHLLSSAAYQKAQVIATYLSMPHEVSTAVGRQAGFSAQNLWPGSDDICGL